MHENTFSIGYTSQVTGLPQSVLRYWETVFPQFCPQKTPGGTRRYTQEDIDVVLKIKNLLYDQKFTIAGAKTFMDSEEHISIKKDEVNLRDYIVSELESILEDLDSS
jgi:DNA-binding transcriptional MerR regulator